jgi:hypothetical protein
MFGAATFKEANLGSNAKQVIPRGQVGIHNQTNAQANPEASSR